MRRTHKRIDFGPELAAHGGMHLCVSDLHLGNFMKDRDGQIVAVDFRGYSFLPHSFFVYALMYPYAGTYPCDLKPYLENLFKFERTASYFRLTDATCLVGVFGGNNIGEKLASSCASLHVLSICRSSRGASV